jgi:uncharacterized membrane protein
MSSTTEKPRTPFWIKIGFPVSIVLNVFLAALIAGHVLQQAGSRLASDTPWPARTLANVEASLSPSDAASFGSVIRGNRARFIGSMSELVQARDRLAKQIVSEPFDPAAVKRDLAAWRQSWNHFLDDFDDTLVEALAKISPDGRRRLVEDRKKGPVGTRPFD